MSLFHKRNIRHFLISIELDNLRNYAEIMEDQLQQQIDGFNEWYEQKTKGMTDEDKNEFGEHHSDDYHTLARINPTLFRSSTLLTIYTCLELNMKRSCLDLQKKLNITVNTLPKKHVKIHDSRDFLIKHDIVKERFFNESNEWNYIDKVYREIRNAFAHGQGEIYESKLAQVQEGIKNLKCSIDNETDEIKLQKDFCPEFIKTIELFFDNLFKEIDPSYFRIQRS
ncbi:hypothetical protein ACFSR7_34455 [Cohnella sp. GCM10020058]|uniref:hypothetical protein n=1 Tax=Cohnella sp. GCM10020058 TaxID=3317330 RepID=UPI003633832C